jgi:hypothetical protein
MFHLVLQVIKQFAILSPLLDLFYLFLNIFKFIFTTDTITGRFARFLNEWRAKLAQIEDFEE